MPLFFPKFAKKKHPITWKAMAPNGKQMESSLLGAEVVNMRSFMSLHNGLIHVDPENISHENIFSETLLEDFSISLLLNCSELTFKGHFCCSRMSVCCFQLHHFSRDTFGSDSCRSECETKGSNLSIRELCTISVNSFTISYHLIFNITQYPEYHHLHILLFSNYLRNFTPFFIQLSSNRGFRCEISQRPGWPTVVKTSKPS